MRSDELNWGLPYASRRDPIFARNVVATSQPLATTAGIEALREGGNAVDAALSAAITLAVVEPCSNGVGSDAFAIVWDGNSLHGLNASGKSPNLLRWEQFCGRSSMPVRGWESVTTPGAVSAWVELSRKFGKLPFERLFDAAVHYAECGFHVGRRTAFHWQRSIETLGQFKPFRSHFLPQERAPQAGELFVRSDLAATLREIAATGGESFYRGRLADQMVKQAIEEGGLLRHDDLSHHSVDWCEPASLTYGDITAHEIPPNGQGVAALVALGVLDRLCSRRFDPGSEEWTHLQVEAMKVAIHCAFQHFSDPNFMEVDVKDLLNPEVLDKVASNIGDRAGAMPPPDLLGGSDTVYLCASDSDGAMVSYIQSNYMGFGSGIVIDGTGIALQNRGAGFSLRDGHPNRVGPGKRPFHTIIPGFVTRQGSPELAFGVMGGHMQHQGHVQMITRIFDHGENPQAASDAPRWHVTPEFGVELERGYSKRALEGLISRGHPARINTSNDVFGGAQLIARLESGYCGASDHRKEGSAAGF